MGSSCRILIVDDDAAIRTLLSRALHRAGYDVRTGASGHGALALVEQWRPDLILLDVMLPDQDGLEICATLKSLPATAAVPVIFVTASSDTDSVLKGFAAGGNDYITKPFTLPEVLARVDVHVRLRRSEAELRRKNARLKELTTELRLLSRVDPLTQLLNRRSWDEAVIREHERFERHGHPYSIIMTDVDCFKAYNDSCGHQAGDECLRRIAAAIGGACRKVDSAGRYGGEEFVILMPEARTDAALKLAERVRRAVWALAVPHPASAVAPRVTVSIGAATARPGSWEDVLKRADDALYMAKRAGRNLVFAGHGPDSVLPRSAPPGGGRAGVVESLSAGNPAVTVLVVAREPAARAACCDCLAQAGYRVRAAADGQAALAGVAEVVPDVIVSEARLPHLDGLACARQLRADPLTCDVPIIMVGGRNSAADVLAGLDAGADEYLIEPIRPAELVLRVRSLARFRREHAELLRSYELRGARLRVLTRLVEFCRDAGACRRLDDVLGQTVAAAADVAGSERVAIMLPDEAHRVLSIARSIGIDSELADAVQVPVGEPIAGQVFTTGRRVVINSAAECVRRAGAYDAHFFDSVPLVSVPLGPPGHTVGVLNVTARPDGRPFETHELEHLELIGKIAGTVIYDIQMRAARDQASDSIMVALAKLAEHRDSDNALHLDRITQFCVMLATKLREQPEFRPEITDTFLQQLRRAVPLHDIGKVAVPDQILLHPGRLSPEQIEIMRTHTIAGANTLQSLVDSAPGVSFLEQAADIARYHHERWDGTGYPVGLRGRAIPLAARIAAVADVYDALTTKRVYKEAYSHDRAVAIIAEGAGTQFDPAVVRAFVELEAEFARLAAALADDCRPAAGQPDDDPAEYTGPAGTPAGRVPGRT
jgi:diguanylate cyclase (GGDEF)-like protein